MICKKMWTAGLYIRLSQEDLDIGKNKKESNSITSQKELLQEFVDKQDDIEIFETYVPSFLILIFCIEKFLFTFVKYLSYSVKLPFSKFSFEIVIPTG